MLEGGLGKRARAALLDQIETTPADEPLVVIATGQYLGEGFDCPQLDTLFLAFPISFKGLLVQYTGRLMRAHEDKTSIRVYDYADVRVPVLRAMHVRRLTTYKTLGFTCAQQILTGPLPEPARPRPPTTAPRGAANRDHPRRRRGSRGSSSGHRLDIMEELYNVYVVSWEVEYTNEFEAWWETLDEEEQEAIDAAVELLEERGPALGRPLADNVHQSRHPNMKELRPAQAIRVLFAFDPRRVAILLIGGDKRGSWNRWYDEMVPVADALYDEHLAEVGERNERRE